MKTGRAVIMMLLAALIAGAAALAQDALVLRYQYAAGATDRYTMKGTLEGSVSGAGQGETPISGTIEGRMTVKTTAVSDQGVATQETTLDQMRVTTCAMGMETEVALEGGKLLINGEPVEAGAGLPGLDLLGQPIRAKVDTRGRLVEMDLGGLGDLFGGFDPSLAQQAPVVFPQEPVAPGDSWSQEMKLPLTIMGEQLEVIANWTYTLVGIEQYQGAPVARIGLKGTAQTRGGAAGADLDRVKQTFSGYELFDYERGRTPYARIAVKSVMSQQGMGMTMSADLEVTLQ